MIIMAAPTRVGIAPKTIPETTSRMVRESKKRPSVMTSGLSITRIPEKPMTTPTIT